MNKPLHLDPDYVQGQIAGLTALVLAAADLLPKEQFAEAFFARLENQRTAMLALSVAETRLVALDHLEQSMRIRLAPAAGRDGST